MNTMHSSIRVRFAPSPTGFLHIGGVRVALFNWLYARKNQGKFLLRIEDTDQERSEKAFTEDIFHSLKWLGLDWDEEVLFQSQRLELYHQKAEELIEQGHAYRCYCTAAEIEAMRNEAIQNGKKPQYNRKCRENAGKIQSKPFVIRAKLPLTGSIQFRDQIRGCISLQNEDLDDFILMRSNGIPTYNLSVVVDDVHSQITHILRGDDHINNTPKQMHLYQFFQYPVPEFAHLPMILGSDKKKLSKRHGAVAASAYRKSGYLPEALLNFLVRLGWSHGDQEIFSIPEMREYFSFEKIQKSSAVFNVEKLLWLNGIYLKKANPIHLSTIITNEYNTAFSSTTLAHVETEIGRKCIHLIQEKVKLIPELVDQLIPLCNPEILEIDTSALKWNSDPILKTKIQNAVKKILLDFGEKIPTEKRDSAKRVGVNSMWGQCPCLADQGYLPEDIDRYFRKITEEYEIRLGDCMQPIRLFLTGKNVSASLFDLIAFLPWDRIEMRLKEIEKA